MSIKKILCPTDFSKASHNALEYAAKFALKTSSSLTLVHVMSLPEIYDNFTTLGLLEDYSMKQNEVENKLKKYTAQIIADFNIPCFYKIDFTKSDSLESSRETGVKQYDLIICGTNGVDTMTQFYFGSTSYNIAKKTEIPALVVPEGCEYKEISSLVFASGYKQGDQLLINQLKSFTQDFSPEFTILHISEKDSAVSQEVYHAFCHLVDEAFDFSQKLNFQRIINEEEAMSIENFMHTSKADVLAVCMEEHGFLYRMFHKSIIKKLTSYADFPILIFHK